MQNLTIKEVVEFLQNNVGEHYCEVCPENDVIIKYTVTNDLQIIRHWIDPVVLEAKKEKLMQEAMDIDEQVNALAPLIEQMYEQREEKKMQEEQEQEEDTEKEEEQTTT